LFFHFLNSAPLIRIEHSFLFLQPAQLIKIEHDFFYFVELLFAFKMGVKYFRTGTMPMRSQHDAFFQIHHDSLVAAEMPCFRACGKIVRFYRNAVVWRATIFMSSPSCLLLSLHNTFDFTAMPSFVAPRYL